MPLARRAPLAATVLFCKYFYIFGIFETFPAQDVWLDTNDLFKIDIFSIYIIIQHLTSRAPLMQIVHDFGNGIR